MKCKRWLNEFNNFVVQKMKSTKINGQQQVYSSTMPAMPKEKSTPVSLNESNFSELEKMKEQLMIATSTQPPVATSIPGNTGGFGNTNVVGGHYHHNQQQQHQHQSAHNNRNSVCGCGAVSTTIDSLNRVPPVLTAADVTGSCGTSCSTVINAVTPTPRITNSCSRNKHQNGKTNSTMDTNKTSVSTMNSSSSSPCLNPIDSSVSIITSSNSISTPSSAIPTNTSSTETATSSSTPPKAEITPPKKSPNDFYFGKFIGEGSYSTVFLAREINTKREYAIKVCEKRLIIRERYQENIRREREVMNIMTNVPGFVKLSCTFQDRRSLYFVMTFAKNGDLLPHINKVGSFDLDCSRHYAAELVLACENMQKRGIVHRDLKPENILLDENMHTLITDFGSAKILGYERETILSSTPPSTATTNGCGRVSPTLDDYYCRRRKNSFVGTAQYVSPEVLQNGPIRPAADLWALGCIIYQMISGLPPFRGSNGYMIFKEVLKCNVEFPEGFDKDAEDLVRKLLKLNPLERLGATDKGSRYDSIRAHPFFAGINFDTIREQTPPPIHPYLPGISKDEEFLSQYRVPDDLEPGLGDRQLTRLLGMELGTSMNDFKIEQKTVRKNIFDLSEAEKQKRLEQQKSDKWHPFAKGEVILKKGFVNKRKGLFARRRMLLLTTGPRLIYIDPVQMVEKGEIPWTSELKVEPKNFKIFLVHTPGRTYYLDDPEGYSLEWVEAIENVRKLSYNDNNKDTNAKTSS